VLYTDSGSYHGVSLGSVIAKSFEHIILERYTDKLRTSELQFGFKRNFSIHACTLVLKEVSSFYACNQSSVFWTFLDVSKAFDRVHYGNLFRLLIKRHIPPFIIRVVISFHAKHCSYDLESSDFSVADGVKQGEAGRH